MPFYVARPEPVSQGDIFENVPFVRRQADETTPQPMLGMVVSHSCDCDKFPRLRERERGQIADTWPISLAPVHDLQLLVGGQAGDAARGRMPRYFHLPEEGEIPERVADLYWEQPVPAVLVFDRLRKVVSLGDEAVEALQAHMFWLRTRRKLTEATAL